MLAGGQSLVPLLSMRLAAPATLVDINAVPDLAAITSRTDDGVRSGRSPGTPTSSPRDDVRRVQPLVTEALAHVAHATIRNRGTTVGSIVHADAAAEMPAVLPLLGGSVEAASVRGTRTIPADELFLGPLESALRPDEIATSAFFPALPAGAGVAFDEIARRHGDYARCGVAAVARRRLVGARPAYVSVAEVPTVVDLSGVPPPETGEAALAQLEPAADIHASVAYRAQLVRVLTERVVRAARATTPSTALGEDTHGDARRCTTSAWW